MRMLPLAEKLSFRARGVVCSDPGTNAVFGSTVSLKIDASGIFASGANDDRISQRVARIGLEIEIIVDL